MLKSVPIPVKTVDLRSLFLPVCNGGFGPLPLVAGNVFVEVGQPAGHRLSDVTQLIPGYSVALQVVCQGALAARKHSVQINRSRHKSYWFLNHRILAEQGHFKQNVCCM